MLKKAKEYRSDIVICLMEKYNMNEIEAMKAIRTTFLNDLLEYYPDETIHDDIEMNADNVYSDYIHPKLLQM